MTIRWDDFAKIEFRIGTVTQAEPLAGARKPAIALTLDFGPEVGEKRSSAQITRRYRPEDLVGRQLLCVTNFPPKRIGPMVSEVLVTGLLAGEGDVVLLRPDAAVPDGTRLG